MKIQISKISKIKRPPTAICHFQNKIYVSTKGKRVFFSSDLSTFKSIVFSSQVNSLSSTSTVLFACQKDGKVFGLNSQHKTVYNLPVSEYPCIQSIFDEVNDDLFVGSETKRITQFSSNAVLKNTFLYSESKLTSFDVNEDQQICRCFQNDPNLHFVRGKEKFAIKILDGYPEIVKFVKKDTVLVGTSTGMLTCFSTVTKKRISFVKLEKQITSICVLKENKFLVGIPNEILLLDSSNFNKMEVIDSVKVDGIPVDFTVSSNVYAAVSRESRIGRFLRGDGNNQIVELSFIE